MAGQHPGCLAGRRLGRIDDPDGRRNRRFHHRTQQRIMRAAQHQRVRVKLRFLRLLQQLGRDKSAPPQP